jgi:hypothetical protein
MLDAPKTTQNTNQRTESAPWAAAQPQLQGLLRQTQGQLQLGTNATDTQNAALGGLAANAQNNPYAPGVGLLANNLLAGGGPDRTGMVQGNYDAFKSSLAPYTTMDTNPNSNQAYQNFTSGLTNDLTDRIKAQYAGAGYSPTSSGDFGKQLGEGIARGVAPTFLQANNDLEARKLGAIQGLYGAGNTTAGLLTGMDQTALGNRQAGVGVASQALDANNQPYMQQLMVEAQRRGIPIQNIAQLENLVVPMAQLGGTSNATGQTTQQTQVPALQQILGAGIAGAGLLGAPFTGGASLGLTGMGAGMFGGGGGNAGLGSFMNMKPSGFGGW